jgi:hypothetical protein
MSLINGFDQNNKFILSFRYSSIIKSIGIIYQIRVNSQKIKIIAILHINYASSKKDPTFQRSFRIKLTQN